MADLTDVAADNPNASETAPTVTTPEPSLPATPDVFPTATPELLARLMQQVESQGRQLQRASEAFTALSARFDSLAPRHDAPGASQLPSQTRPFLAQPKLPTLRLVNGKRPTELRNWFESARTYLSATQIAWDSPRAVSFLAAHFEGELAKWWTFRVNAHANDPVAGLASATELQDAAMRFHAERAPDEDARDKIGKLRQLGSVLSYAHRLQELLLHLPDRSEADKVHNFTSGLKAKVKTEVVLKRPKTLEEAIRLAVEADALLLQHGLLDRRSNGAAPMELGSSSANPSNTKGRLTRQEKDRLRKEGGCFYCRATDHMIKDCPVRPARETKN